jgi:hypothetical protein
MMVVIWGGDKAKYFFGEGWTAKSQVGPSGKSITRVNQPMCPSPSMSGEAKNS